MPHRDPALRYARNARPRSRFGSRETPPWAANPDEVRSTRPMGQRYWIDRHAQCPRRRPLQQPIRVCCTEAHQRTNQPGRRNGQRLCGSEAIGPSLHTAPSPVCRRSSGRVEGVTGPPWIRYLSSRTSLVPDRPKTNVFDYVALARWLRPIRRIVPRIVPRPAVQRALRGIPLRRCGESFFRRPPVTGT